MTVRRSDDLLEVVDDEQRLAPRELIETVGADCAEQSRLHKAAVGDRGKGDEEHAAGELVHELGADLHGEPRLARPAGTGQRHYTHGVAKQRRQFAELPTSPHERARRDGQVRRVEAPQRRELAVAELVDRLRLRQILEAVVAETAERRIRTQGARVALETSVWPPCPTAAIRAAR